jgi:cytochrome c
MKYIWMLALCANFILLGCQSEKEEVAQPKPGANISVETESEAAKVTEAAKAAEAVKAAEAAKVAEAARMLAAAEVAKAAEAVKIPEAAKAIIPVGAGGAGSASIPTASAGDAINGKHLAKRCKGCHSFKPDRKQMTGPNLFGVFGRTAGKNTDFSKYSSDLKNASFVWDETRLAAWVCNSKEAIKALTKNPAAKTRMREQKKCGTKGQDIAAYLKSLK